MTAEQFLHLLKKMMRHGNSPSIHLVLDNPSAHKATLMKRYVEPTNAGLSV